MSTALQTDVPAIPAPRSRRWVALLVAAGSATLLVVSAWLTPASRGLGTHEQLNLPPCGWISLMDIPCPTCGMTTAFAHAADGHLAASFLAQPAGCALAIGTAMALIVSTYVAITGSPVAGELRRLWHPRTGWVIAAAVVAAWLFKLARYRGWL